MNMKRLLIFSLMALLFLLPATTLCAKTPYAVWCAGNKTLYFTNTPETLAPGDAFDGQEITAVWSKTDVTNSGDYPAWNIPSVRGATRVVFFSSFESVRPNCTRDWFSNFYQLTSITGMEYLDTRNVYDMGYMFYGCSNLTNIDVTHFDTSNVVSMSNMFWGCSSLTSLDVTNFDTSNVHDMASMFYDCSNLTTFYLTNFDTSNVIAMDYMFSGCSSLTTIYCNNTWSGASGDDMFKDCTSLVGGEGMTYDPAMVTVDYANPSVSGYFTLQMYVPYVVWCAENSTLYFTYTIDVLVPGGTYDGHTITAVWSWSDVTDCGTSNPAWNSVVSSDVTAVVFDDSFKDVCPTSTHGWFSGCYQLTYILDMECYLDTRNVTDMGSMFWYCSGLTSLDVTHFNTSQVTDMREMFCGCSGLTSLDVTNFDTSNVTDMASMLNGCSSLPTLDVMNFDTSNVTDMMYMFNGCSNLTAIYSYGSTTWSATSSWGMFSGCTNLVGGEGMTYQSDKVTADYANSGMSGYFTARAIPYVLWCEGNHTLYFLSTNDLLVAGDMYDGQTITAVWSKNDVSHQNKDQEIGSLPGWYDMRGDVTSAVFDASFQSVQPTSTYSWFSECSQLTSITGLSYLDTSHVIDMGDMFKDCSSLTSLDVTTFDTSNATNIGGMFSGCSGLTSIDVTNFDTSHVTLMLGVFKDCSGLTSIDLTYFDTSSAIIMSYLFSGCTGLTSLDVTHFDTSKAIYMDWMFADCNNLTSLDVTHFDTSNVTNMEAMFWNCSSLTSLDVTHFDTSKVVNMGVLFGGCSGLTDIDVTNFDTSNAENITSMFYGCSNLTSINVSNFDTSNATNMMFMFCECSGLTSLDVSNFDTSSVRDMQCMFDGCSSLTSLDVSNFDMSNVSDTEAMFRACSSLTTIFCNDTWGGMYYDDEMFLDCTNLVGEYGAMYAAGNDTETFANPGTSGYFTLTEETLTANYVDGEYWATYYNSYVGGVADANTTVYTAALNSDKRTLSLTEVVDKTINKGQAVLLKSTSNTITLTRTSEDGTGDFSENSLSGKDAETAVPTDEGTIYTLALENGKLGFYKYTGTTLGARKAYLAIMGGSEAGIRFDNEEATGIADMSNVEGQASTHEVHDLMGRRVSVNSVLPKGVYIVNGKKVFVK